MGETDTLATLLVPGDTSVAKLTVFNASQTAAHGAVNVQFYLVDDGTLDTTTATLIGSATQT